MVYTPTYKGSPGFKVKIIPRVPGFTAALDDKSSEIGLIGGLVFRKADVPVDTEQGSLGIDRPKLRIEDPDLRYK